jgi:hypothetical protein
MAVSLCYRGASALGIRLRPDLLQNRGEAVAGAGDLGGNIQGE